MAFLRFLLLVSSRSLPAEGQSTVPCLFHSALLLSLFVPKVLSLIPGGESFFAGGQSQRGTPLDFEKMLLRFLRFELSFPPGRKSPLAGGRSDRGAHLLFALLC